MPRKPESKPNWNIPKDAVLLESRDGWLIYHAPAEGRLYIYPGDYHAEALPLTAADLGRFLAKLAQAKPAVAETGAEEPDVPH